MADNTINLLFVETLRDIQHTGEQLNTIYPESETRGNELLLKLFKIRNDSLPGSEQKYKDAPWTDSMRVFVTENNLSNHEMIAFFIKSAEYLLFSASRSHRRKQYEVSAANLHTAINMHSCALTLLVCDQLPDKDHSLIRSILSENARKGGFAAHRNSKKQQEKKFVFECWEDWRKNPDKYGGKAKAAFARAMLDKCEHLKSQKKIEDFCREWERTGTLQAE